MGWPQGDTAMKRSLAMFWIVAAPVVATADDPTDAIPSAEEILANPLDDAAYADDVRCLASGTLPAGGHSQRPGPGLPWAGRTSVDQLAAAPRVRACVATWCSPSRPAAHASAAATCSAACHALGRKPRRAFVHSGRFVLSMRTTWMPSGVPCAPAARTRRSRKRFARRISLKTNLGGLEPLHRTGMAT